MADGYLLGDDQPNQVDEHDAWMTVTSSLPDLRITPFEAKALYAFALMRQLAESCALLHDTRQASCRHEPPSFEWARRF